MNDIDKDKLTPMMKQYFDIKEKYEDYILFYRLGDFYEMFFDDAVTASKVLEIALTGRNCGLNERAPLCGVPHHSANSYIEKMINSGYKVAICEQTENPLLAKGLVKREVTRIVTPGTVIDPEMLENESSNYILALFYDGKRGYSASYADITTGKMNSFESCDKNGVLDEINKLSPGEILIQDHIAYTDESLFSGLKDFSLTNLSQNYYKFDKCRDMIVKMLNIHSLDSTGIDENSKIIPSAGALIEYVIETQKVSLSHIKNIRVYSLDDHMMLDKFTMKNLEIVESIRTKSTKGSLLNVIDYTSTSMGARRLKSVVFEPLLNIDVIDKRLDSVEELHDDIFFREELRVLLKGIYDIERLSSKLVYGNITPRDFTALKHSIGKIPGIKLCLSAAKSDSIKEIHDSLDTLDDIYDMIDRAIVEDPPISIKDGGVIRSQFSKEISEINDAIENGNDWLSRLELSEKNATGIKNLKIGFNRVFGYFIEITKSNLDNVPYHYVRKQTLSNCERFITDELKQIEDKILGAGEKRIELENLVYNQLKESCLQEVNRMLNASGLISYLDVLASLAYAAELHHFTRPQLNDKGIIEIENGRHPVVETLLPPSSFIPNDTLLDDNDNLIYIITGPNMAGKSTYLRQVALITLLSQIGSFVPADSANIGVVDRIFTRVGASDDIASGQSTFMVEMNELANILKNATSKSLVILDEIGRGTGTYDGLSIAWATIEYISDFSGNRPKTMFATHYHELTELEGKFRGVKNYRIAVDEVQGDIVFLRKIVRGTSGKSYGIQVAKLAGVPQEVIDIASSILIRLEANDINNNIESILDDAHEVGEVKIDREKDKVEYAFKNEGNQIGFFNFDDEYIQIKNLIAKIDINNITPVQALTILDEIIGKVGSGS